MIDPEIRRALHEALDLLLDALADDDKPVRKASSATASGDDDTAGRRSWRGGSGSEGPTAIRILSPGLPSVA